MDETTTTEVAPETSGAVDTAQPEVQEQTTSAEVRTEPTQPDTTSQDESSATSAEGESELHAWAKSKGIDPSDPAYGDKVAELARKAEQEFTKRQQQAKNALQEASQDVIGAADADATQIEIAKINSRLAVNDFFAANPDARELESEMAEIVMAKPYLVQDLDAIYALAKTRHNDDAVKAAKSQGREEAKAEIARAGAAKLPKGNASSSSTIAAEDPFVAGFDNPYGTNPR